MEDAFQYNRKISIFILIGSILIQVFFLALLILKIVNRGIYQIPYFLTYATCPSYLQVKYQSLQSMNIWINVCLFLGVAIGFILIVPSVILLVKNLRQEEANLKTFNLFFVFYGCLAFQCLISAILLGYQISFKLQSKTCSLSLQLFTLIQILILAFLLLFCILFFILLAYLIKKQTKEEQKKKKSLQINQQQEQLKSQFQKKSKQMYQSLLNRKQFKFDVEKSELKQNQQNKSKINVEEINKQTNNKSEFNQGEKQISFQHDKSQFQSLKSLVQSSQQTPKYVQQKIGELKQLGFQMEYADSQNKVKLTRGYMLPDFFQSQAKSKQNENLQGFMNFVVTLDKNNNPSPNQQIIFYQDQRIQNQTSLIYEQSKEQKQIKKAKKRQIKRQLLQMKLKRQADQLCPLLPMIQQDEINQQQAIQKRIFEQKNQLQDFRIGAQLCLFKPNFDRLIKDSQQKMQGMYAETLVYHDEQYMDRKQYQEKLQLSIKENSKNRQLLKNNPISMLIQSSMSSKSKVMQKNRKQRKKLLQQMRGKSTI